MEVICVNDKQLAALERSYKMYLELVHVLDEDPDLPDEFRSLPKDMRKMGTDIRMAIVEYKNKK